MNGETKTDLVGPHVETCRPIVFGLQIFDSVARPDLPRRRHPVRLAPSAGRHGRRTTARRPGALIALAAASSAAGPPPWRIPGSRDLKLGVVGRGAVLPTAVTRHNGGSLRSSPRRHGRRSQARRPLLLKMPMAICATAAGLHSAPQESVRRPQRSIRRPISPQTAERAHPCRLQGVPTPVRQRSSSPRLQPTAWMSTRLRVSRRLMLRIAAFASSVVASNADRLSLHQTRFGQPLQNPGEHLHVGLDVDPPPRARQRRVVRRRLRHVQIQKRPQTQSPAKPSKGFPPSRSRRRRRRRPPRSEA